MGNARLRILGSSYTGCGVQRNNKNQWLINGSLRIMSVWISPLADVTLKIRYFRSFRTISTLPLRTLEQIEFEITDVE